MGTTATSGGPSGPSRPLSHSVDSARSYGYGEAPLSADEEFLRLALGLAQRGLEAGEVPVGAVVVRDGLILGRAHNTPVRLADPTAHAEIMALREAGRRLGNYRLPGATLYVTVEPCPMCCGAALHARVARAVYGPTDPMAAAVESLHRLLDHARFNHRVDTPGRVLAHDRGT